MPNEHTPDNLEITAEAITRYVEGTCAAGERIRIEAAMKKDPDLKKEIEDMRDIIGEYDPENGTEAPAHVIQRAKDLVHPKYGALAIEILAEIREAAFHRLSTAAAILCGPQTAEPVLLRGESLTPKQNILVQKRIGDLEIQVAVGIHDEARHITLFLDPPDQAQNINGILFLKDQELESHGSRDGQIFFEDIGDGEYFIELHQGGRLLGAIKISLTSHG